jgi:DNA-binding LytR/AlgR family response regulator
MNWSAMESSPLNAYLVDDEPLAIERLTRLLANFDGLTIAGSAIDAVQAIRRRAFSGY